MNSKVRKAIAGFEMLTGIVAAFNILFFLIEQNHPQNISISKDLFFLLLYIGEAYAGRLLWWDKSWGYTLSIVAQSLHLLTCELALVGYQFTALAHFFLYYRQGEAPGFDATLGEASYAINFFSGSPPSMLGINVVALVLLVLLVRARKKKSHEKEQTNH